MNTLLIVLISLSVFFLVFVIIAYIILYCILKSLLYKEKVLKDRIDNLFLEFFKKRTFKDNKEYKEYVRDQRRRVKRIESLYLDLNKIIIKIEFFNNIPLIGKV